ncbi:polysaccharide deacetylase [halophilic archaeon]|nr:polysaccharide deacetylase [halophilic archaeon]
MVERGLGGAVGVSDETLATTRRGALRAGLTVAGATLVAGSAVAADTNAKVVFTYDDGPVEDYTHTYRKAHRKEGVPGCSAVPSAYVGNDGTLDAARLRELEDEGWEIMSHSVHHRALGDIAVTRDVAPDDRRLYVRTNHHGDRPGDDVVVTDGSASTTVTVAGKGEDERGEFVTLRSPVGRSFAADDGVIERYTDEILRSALGDSKAQLEDLGLTVTNVVMPYGGYGERTQELAGEYYTAVANGGLAIGGRAQVHRPDDVTLPHLSRAMFRRGKMTKADLGAFLDRVVDADGLGILGGHSWWQERLPPERVRMAIRMAKDRDLDVVTLREALDDLGVTGTKRKTTQTTRTAQTTRKTTEKTTGKTGTGTNGFPANGETSDDPPTSSTGQPGFGWLAALGGVGGAAALRRWRGDR